MSTTQPTSSHRPAANALPRSGARTAYVSVVGLASLVVLLQAVWAGLFIQEGEDYKDSWVEWHARGADLAIVLALVAAVIAIARLRARMDLVVGSVVFLLLLAFEAYLGGLIGAHSRLTVVHFPIGMALMALSVWLPLRATRS